MRIGIAHHLGWAVAVTASTEHLVTDRRRIELIEPGLPVAPIHHVGGPQQLHHGGMVVDDDTLKALVAEVRASVERATSAALDELDAAAGGAVTTLAVRRWADDFPEDVAVQRRVPYESRADSVMYAATVARLATARGWRVERYDAATVETDATARLGDRAHEVLHGPRRIWGPPWTKDHRVALAATIVTGSG